MSQRRVGQAWPLSPGLLLVGGVTGWLLSVLIVLLAYADWSWIFRALDLALLRVDLSRWLLGLGALSGLSVVFPFVSVWFSQGTESEFRISLAVYSVAFLWIPILLIYPGPEAVGLDADPRFVWVGFGIVLAQQIPLRVAGHQVWKAYTSPVGDPDSTSRDPGGEHQ